MASAGVCDAFSVLACRQGQGVGPEGHLESLRHAGRPTSTSRLAASESGDLDLRALGQALVRNRRWIIIPTLLAAVLSITAVNLVTPRYKSEARILIDGRENVFLRPNGERNEERTALDPRPSPARSSSCCRAISRVKSSRRTSSPSCRNSIRSCKAFRRLKSLLALFGIGRDPFSLTPEERVLDAYFDRFTAYAVDKSRVIVIEFQSRDPGSGRARRQLDRRRLSGAAAGRAAGAGQVRQPMAVGRNRKSAQEGCGRRIPRRGFSFEIEPVSSAPTTPRSPISRWAN